MSDLPRPACTLEEERAELRNGKREEQIAGRSRAGQRRQLRPRKGLPQQDGLQSTMFRTTSLRNLDENISASSSSEPQLARSHSPDRRSPPHQLETSSDAEVATQADSLRYRARSGEPPAALLTEACSLVVRGLTTAARAAPLPGSDSGWHRTAVRLRR